MKLIDLNPKWYGSGGKGHTDKDGNTLPRREGLGITFNCPCGCSDQLAVSFTNPLDGQPPRDGHTWQRTGDTFETLTLSPSLLRSKDKGGCGWHGWVRNGQIITC